MNRRGSLAAALLSGAAVLLLGAPTRGQAPSTVQQSRPDNQAVQAIQAWMECQDCSEERAAVARLGVPAVPLLGEYLRGPTAEKRELARRALEAAYRRMKQYEASHPAAKVPMTQEEYIKTYLANYVAQYQVRSATGLADIGGPEATKLLEEAQQAPLRGDVKAVIHRHLERMKKR